MLVSYMLANSHEPQRSQSASHKGLYLKADVLKETSQPGFEAALLRHRSTRQPQSNHSPEVQAPFGQRQRRGSSLTPSTRPRHQMITRWLTAALLLRPTNGLAKGGFATDQTQEEGQEGRKGPEALGTAPTGPGRRPSRL